MASAILRFAVRSGVWASAFTAPLAAQAADPDALVIVTGQQAAMPIPTCMEGPQNLTANSDVADQLFLRLAELPPDLVTTDERRFVPVLAKSWTRRDSLTLAFDLDPRARWHNGRPVTAADVVFTFERARNPKVAPKLAGLLHHIVSVAAEGARRVVIRFDRVYAEQFYDATFNVAPMPAGLVPADAAPCPVVPPVGDGPFRWVRSVPGQFVELAADSGFFLGAPKIRRLFFRTAADPEARVNLLLSGEADATDNIPSPPLSNVERVEEAPGLRVVPLASPVLGYLLFNQRDRGDSTKPHPILSDPSVRRAIALALDRRRMVQSVFGRYGDVPFGPASRLLWIQRGAPAAAGQDTAQARRLLAKAGWVARNEDGILTRDGHPLALSLSYPLTSEARKQMALQVQEQLRGMGIRIDLQRLEGPVWAERRAHGNFDIDFSSATQDPTPSGLTQSWSCSGGTNVAHYCDLGVDSLLNRAITSPPGPAAGRLWQEVLRRIEADQPAVPMYSIAYVYAVSRRFRKAPIRPESSWLRVREWSR
ncbi:MAG TPA: ABC transporter substrate-binding protein [Gemmatimonadales bacterium]